MEGPIKTLKLEDLTREKYLLGKGKENVFKNNDIYGHNRDLLPCEKKLINTNTINKDPNYVSGKEFRYQDNSSDSEDGRNGTYAYSTDWLEKKSYDRKYVIDLYGINEFMEDYCYHVVGFMPYFFVKCPEIMNAEQFAKTLRSYLLGDSKSGIPNKYKKNLRSLSIVHYKDFYGFTNNTKFPFIKLEFDNLNARNSAKNVLGKKINLPGLPKQNKYTLYEANFDPILRFMHLRNIISMGWVKANNYTVVPKNERTTNCTYELSCLWSEIGSINDPTIGKINRASFDIEQYSHDHISFPNSSIPEDEIIQICTTFRRHGESESFLKVAVTQKESLDLPNTVIIPCKSEKEVLQKWQQLLYQMRPDIRVGHNTTGYDEPCIERRSRMHNLNDFSIFAKTKGKRCKFRKLFLSSSALGQNELYYYKAPGMVCMDLLKIVQAKVEEKLPYHNLNFLSRHYLNDEKDDLSPQEMWECFREGSPESIRKITKYCIQDCELVQRLMDHLKIIYNAAGMADATFVPVTYLGTRGSLIKVFSLVSKICFEKGYLIPVLEKEEFATEEEKEANRVRGAFVVTPVPGVYELIATLDFNALYPSVMRALNLSHDTCVLDPKYLNLPGIEYRKLKYYLKNGEEVITHFVKQSSQKGLISIILEYLNEEREKAKALMKKAAQAKDDDLEGVFNGQQLAFKVVANSVYGATIALTSALRMRHIGGCTTTKGQSAIKFAYDYAVTNYNAEVIYGDTDSIFVKVPVPDLPEDAPLEVKMKATFSLLKELAEGITKHINHPPIKIIVEKIWEIIMILSKKRYSGIKYEEAEIMTDKFKKKTKRSDSGSALKRRDCSKLVKEFMEPVVTKIMEKRPYQEIHKSVKENVKKTLKGEYPIEYFIKSATLKTEYKKKPIHAIVAEEVAKEDPGSAFRPNERVPYVYRCIPPKLGKRGQPLKSRKKTDQARFPDFVIRDHDVIDYKLYLTDQVCKPLTEILQLYDKDAKKTSSL
jgi:DNA polymerase delta subunit 1